MLEFKVLRSAYTLGSPNLRMVAGMPLMQRGQCFTCLGTARTIANKFESDPREYP